MMLQGYYMNFYDGLKRTNTTDISSNTRFWTRSWRFWYFLGSVFLNHIFLPGIGMFCIVQHEAISTTLCSFGWTTGWLLVQRRGDGRELFATNRSGELNVCLFWTFLVYKVEMCELHIFSLNGEVVLEEIEGLNDTKMHIKILDMWVYAEGMHGYVFKKTALPFGTFSLSPVFQQGHLCFSGSCLATWAEGQLHDLPISQDPPQKNIKNTQFGSLVINLETLFPQNIQTLMFWACGLVWHIISKKFGSSDPLVTSQKHWKEKFQRLGIILVMIGMLVRGELYIPRYHAMNVENGAGATCWYQHAQCCTKGSWATKTRQGLAEKWAFNFGWVSLWIIVSRMCRRPFL